MKTRYFVILALLLFRPEFADALSVELSQVKTDEQTLLAVYGSHTQRVKGTSLSVDGQLFKSEGQAGQYELSVVGRNRLFGSLYTEAEVATFNTHDRLAFGGGFQFGPFKDKGNSLTLSMGMAFAQEYAGSPRFKDVFKGSPSDQAIGTISTDFFFGSRYTFAGDVSFVQDYDADQNRMDFTSALRVDVDEHLYFGVRVSRVRFSEKQHLFVGLNF